MPKSHLPMPQLTNRFRRLFYSKITIDPKSGCWIFNVTSSVQTRYPYLKAGSKTYIVDRVAYWIFFGEEPGLLLVCHTCDNPRCCNPCHLFLGTDQDNKDDSIAKGRSPSVTYPKLQDRPTRLNHQSKLTEEVVRKIKDQLKSGVPPTTIAREYGVSKGAIYQIKQGKTWSWV